MPGAAPPWQLTVCHVCHRCLAHPPGSTLLICPACRRLLNLSGLPPLSTAAQTSCLSCATVMLHPLGTRVVVCPLCAAHTPASLSFYVCPGCALYLVYSSTLPAVVCAVCHTVEPPIDAPPPNVPTLLPLKPHEPPRPMPRLPPRHIPWLPSTPVRPVSGPRPLSMPRALLPPHPPPPPPPPPDNTARPRRADTARPRSTPVVGTEELRQLRQQQQQPQLQQNGASPNDSTTPSNPLVRRQSGLPSQPPRPRDRGRKEQLPPSSHEEEFT